MLDERIIDSAFDAYKRYYLRSVLLEVFGKNKPLENDEILKYLIPEVQKTGGELFDSITDFDIKPEYEYLVKMGYFMLVEDDTKITLSELGMKALRECVWESLASTAFFGYKGLSLSAVSLKISKKSLRISALTLILSFFAVLASVVSLVLVLYK